MDKPITWGNQNGQQQKFDIYIFTQKRDFFTLTPVSSEAPYRQANFGIIIEPYQLSTFTKWIKIKYALKLEASYFDIL